MALTFTTTIRDRVAAVAFGGRAWSALSTVEQNAVAAAGAAAEKMLAAVAARVTGTSASLPDSWEAWLEAAALRRVSAGWDENRLALLARDEDAAREAAISAWVDAAAAAVGVDTSDTDDAAAYVRAAATRRTPPVYATASEINAAIGYAVSAAGYDAFADIPTRLRNLVADLALQRFLHNAGAGSVGAVEDARREIDRQRGQGDGAEKLATETPFATGATYNDAGIRAMVRAAGASRENPVLFTDAQIDAAIAYAAGANGLGNGADAIADAPDTLQPLLAQLAVARALATRGVEPEATVQAAQAAIDAERGRLGGTTAWTAQTPFTTATTYNDDGVRALIRAGGASRRVFLSDQQVDSGIAYAVSACGLTPGADAVATAPERLRPMVAHLALLKALQVAGVVDDSDVRRQLEEIERERVRGGGVEAWTSATVTAAGAYTDSGVRDAVRAAVVPRGLFLDDGTINAAIAATAAANGLSPGENAFQRYPSELQPLLTQQVIARVLYNAGVAGAGDMLSEAEDQMHRQRAAFETQMSLGPGLVADVWDGCEWAGGGGWPIC